MDNGVSYYPTDQNGKSVMVDFGDIKSEIMVDTNGYAP